MHYSLEFFFSPSPGFFFQSPPTPNNRVFNIRHWMALNRFSSKISRLATENRFKKTLFTQNKIFQSFLRRETQQKTAYIEFYSFLSLLCMDVWRLVSNTFFNKWCHLTMFLFYFFGLNFKMIQCCIRKYKERVNDHYQSWI